MQNSSSHFGDCRLDQAERFLHGRLVEVGPRGISVRSVGGNRAGEVRFGRFLRNEKVTVKKIVEKAGKVTSGRVDGLHVLAIQDTTSFRDDGSGNCIVGHATIAVEAEQGTLLGAVDMQLIERSGGRKKPPKNRPLREKESYRWLESMQTSAAVLNAAANVTVIADREGDIFEMFACRPKGVDVLVRASHDRNLSDDTGKLFFSLEGTPQQEHTVELPARPGQKKRTARIGVRFACVTLPHPKNRPIEQGVPASTSVYIVEAREIDPPVGVQPAQACPEDKVNRAFTATAPNQLWVSDFTYVSTWAGMVYVAFVIDVFARKIVGWRVSTSMTTSFVLDALNQAICQRIPSQADGLIHHSDRGSQYLAVRYTERLAQAGIDASVGSVGDSYDNALAESIIGLFKTEVIEFFGTWKTVGQVEWETLDWVSWYNNKRLHGAIGHRPPQELEDAFYANLNTLDKVA